MLKTLRISFSLKNTYKANGVLYAIKQLPLIKKLLPDSLYGVRAFKIIANIISVLLELSSIFVSKAVYVLLMIFLPAGMYNNGANAFMLIFLLLSIIGALNNTYMFNPAKDKYYAIVLMRMNAREYTLINYSYELFKLFLGLLIFGTLFGRFYNVPLYFCLFMPVFIVCIRLSVAAVCLQRYKKTGSIKNDMKLGKAIWAAILLLLIAAYGLPLLNISVNFAIIAAIFGLAFIAGVASLFKIISCKQYAEIYKKLLFNFVSPQELSAQLVRKQNNDNIVLDESTFSHKQGFEYLNELFIKRHRKILWKSSITTTLICAAVIVGLLAATVLITDVRQAVNEFALSYLPYFLFIMYAINRGTGFTTALFANCDHSLLSYSFYKKPKFVLKLFQIRLREIIKINLLPAAVIGAGLSGLLYFSGGTADLLNYILLPLSIMCMSVFFSVHYLTLYYLLQPYNAGTEIKSPTYTIMMSATYLLCLGGMQLKTSTLGFSLLIIAFCVIYCALASLAVYKIAPKTFKIRT